MRVEMHLWEVDVEFDVEAESEGEAVSAVERFLSGRELDFAIADIERSGDAYTVHAVLRVEAAGVGMAVNTAGALCVNPPKPILNRRLVGARLANEGG